MYLMAGNTAFYSFVMRRSCLELYGASTALLALLALFGYYGAYIPLQRYIAVQERMVMQLKEQQKALSRGHCSVQKVQACITDIKKSYHWYASTSAAQHASHAFLATIAYVAKANHVSLARMSLGVSSVQPWHIRQEMTLQAQGSLSALVTFLEKLHAQKQCVHVTQLELVAQAAMLQANVTIQLILFKEQ